ncbi:MAG TPA: EF-Tu/IF-2/RF-3 family GTPase [Vicinamibacterales bacterium]|nr:EF-Tu/IF-2/RF-3 family GTPase [Vicinamibacterales bacterium]
MATDPLFRMPIDDTFAIAGLGTVAAGHIASGTLKVGDVVFVNTTSPDRRPGSTKTAVIGLQLGPAAVREAHQGDLVGVVLRGVKLEAIGVGDVLAATKLEA